MAGMVKGETGGSEAADSRDRTSETKLLKAFCMRKIFWNPLSFVCLCMLAVIAFFRNIPTRIYNRFHLRKKKYWHPVDWLAKEEYDIYE